MSKDVDQNKVPCTKSCKDCAVFNFSIFKNLSTEEIEKLAATKVVKRFAHGEVLELGVEQAEGVYCIGSGWVNFQGITKSGKPHIVRQAKRGDAVGILCAFSGRKNGIERVAHEEVLTCFVPVKEVKEILATNDQFKDAIIDQITEQMYSLENRMVSMMTKTAKQRIAEALIYFSNGTNQCTCTRKDISDWTAVSFENVIRTLAEFQKAGMIIRKRRGITIMNASKLAKITE